MSSAEYGMIFFVTAPVVLLTVVAVLFVSAWKQSQTNKGGET